jgi:rhodanese-related sulfurtransferase
VRTAEEFARGSLPQARHTPGGQLLQATDQYVGVRKARVVVFDAELVRAPVVASWLVQMGWDASVLRAEPEAFGQFERQGASTAAAPGRTDHVITAAEWARMSQDGAARLVDVRPSTKYRALHLRDAVWAIRPRLAQLGIEPGEAVTLVADDIEIAALAADELRAQSGPDVAVSILLEGPTAWKAAGLDVAATPDTPPDADCIDYLFFVHDRHDGNRAAALKYLEWETDLVRQIDAQERAEFRFA